MFNRRLALSILALNFVLGIRLLGAAIESSNWPGFIYSILQLGVVSAGTYWAIRRPSAL